jgi:chaperonin GroEL
VLKTPFNRFKISTPSASPSTSSAIRTTSFLPAAVVITDKKVSSVQEFLPILEKLAAAGKKDVVLIADEVEGEALGVLILNRLKGVFNTVAVKAPSFGDRRKDVLADIAALTGATVITDDQGLSFENVGLEVVGTARKVIVGKDSTNRTLITQLEIGSHQFL